MQRNEFVREGTSSPETFHALSAAELGQLAHLLAELKETTQSRATYAAATAFLKRLGANFDDATLVRPESYPA